LGEFGKIRLLLGENTRFSRRFSIGILKTSYDRFSIFF